MQAYTEAVTVNALCVSERLLCLKANPARRTMTAQKPIMAKLNQIMPPIGSPRRFSLRMEINDRTSSVMASSATSP